MTGTETISILKSMKLPAMAEALKNQLENNDDYRQMSFEDRLGLMVDAEQASRKANRLKKLVNGAKFSNPRASIEDIEYFDDRKLNKDQILKLSTCGYINDGRDIILRGASGNGKTYIACALGNAACRCFKTIRYVRMPELLDELNVARSCNEVSKAIKFYQKRIGNHLST